MEKGMKRGKKKIVLKLLEESRGIVSYACKNGNISRETFYRWCREDKDFKQAVDEISEENIDIVESKLFTKINDGDLTAIIFFLKTKGRKRGYVEKTEIEGDINPSLKVEIIDKREDVRTVNTDDEDL